MGQHQPAEREQSDAPARQARDCEARDQNQEHVEQAPAFDPGARRAVSPERSHQSVPGRQVQRSVNLGEAALPAGRGHRSTGIDVAHGLNIHGRRAQLDPARTFHASLRDQQVLVRDARTQQVIGRDHVEAPALPHAPADAVDRGEPAVREIEPQLTCQAELILIARREGATALDYFQFRIALHAVGRILTPFRRNIGLTWIDRLRAFHRSYTQAIHPLEAPDLIVRPRPFARGTAQRVCDCAAARPELDLPIAGPHLHAQAPIGFEPRRQFTGQTHGHESLGQHGRQQLFACFARRLHAYQGRQLRRYVVTQQTVDLQCQLLRFNGTAPLTEPHRAATSFRLCYRPPLERQGNDSSLRRHGQSFGTMSPAKVATNVMTTGTQTDLRSRAARDDRCTYTIHLYLAWPMLEIPGQADPGIGIQIPVLCETAPVRIEIENQAFRPRTLKRTRVDGLAPPGVRAATVLLSLQYPALPRLQLRAAPPLRLRTSARGSPTATALARKSRVSAWSLPSRAQLRATLK